MLLRLMMPSVTVRVLDQSECSLDSIPRGSLNTTVFGSKHERATANATQTFHHVQLYRTCRLSVNVAPLGHRKLINIPPQSTCRDDGCQSARTANAPSAASKRSGVRGRIISERPILHPVNALKLFCITTIH